MPTLHPEEFPLLNNQQTNETTNILFNSYKCFLIMKYKKQDDTPLAELDPWKVENYIRSQVCRGGKYIVKSIRSGALLIEVDREQSKDKLLKCKKMHNVDIVVEEHNSLNSSKGVFQANTLSKLSNDKIKDLMISEGGYNVKEVYRIIRKDRQKNTDEPTNKYIITFGTPSLPVRPGQKIKVGYEPVVLDLYIPTGAVSHTGAIFLNRRLEVSVNM